MLALARSRPLGTFMSNLSMGDMGGNPISMSCGENGGHGGRDSKYRQVFKVVIMEKSEIKGGLFVLR